MAQVTTNTNYPALHQEGHLTREGEQLVEWIEAQYAEADRTNDLPFLNGMSGPFKEYYALVAKTRALTPLAWVRDMSSSARNAYDLMKWVEAKAAESAAVIENTAKTNDIAAQFEAFKEAMTKELKEANDRIAELTAKPDKPAKGAKKDADAEAEAEA